MILYEPRVDEYFLPFSVVLSMNLLVLFTNHLLFYYSSSIQKFLLDELWNSKDNPGFTLQGKKYDNNLYVSMKAFWDQFAGEITHEHTCTSCKITSENWELPYIAVFKQLWCLSNRQYH